MKEESPILDLPKTQLESILDGLTLAGVTIGLGVVLFYYNGLPESIPIHFDGKGQPDDYGSKVMLPIIMGIATIMAIGLWQLTRIPHKYNYPIKVTVENAPELYRKGRLLIRGLNTGIVWMFTFITWKTIEIAKGQADDLGQWFLLIFIIITAAFPIIMTIQMAMKNKKSKP